MPFVNLKEAEKLYLKGNKYAGAIRYAQANSTDPFAYARALTHIRMGMAHEGDYDATRSDEEDGPRWSEVKRL